MSPNYSPPLKFNNNDLVEIVELDNSLIASDYNLTDTEFENYITTNLTQYVLPNDLSNSFPSSNSNSLKIISDAIGPKLINKTAFINNESLINSELFGMKVDYVVLNTGSNPDSFNLPIGDVTTNKINLDASSNSIFNSNLKIDVTYSGSQQLTDATTSNPGVWAVGGNRRSAYGIINTFSSVNSIYNQTNINDISNSPFYIKEETNNNVSLGNNSTKWFSSDYSGVSVGNGKLVPNTIPSNNQLGTNNITSTVLSADYSFNQFNKYRVLQSTPTITAALSASAELLPFQYVSGGVASDLSSTTFNFSGAITDVSGVGSGFTLVLDVSAGGGYSYDSLNPLFTLDPSELTRDATDPYMTLQNLEDLSHVLTFTNGNTTLTTVTDNKNFITIADEEETLDNNYNSTNGLITIVVDDSNNRVYYTDGSGSNVTGSYGTKTDLTNYVNVAYPGEASPSIADFSYGELLVTENVNFYVEVLAQSTVYTNPSVFFNADLSRNLAYDYSSILVIASPNELSGNVIVPSYEDFNLTSYIEVSNNQVYIISIENQSILTQDTELLDNNDNIVPNTTATVTMKNIDLSNNASPYSDFEVKLTTKTIGDLSNILHLTNNWSINGLDSTPLEGTALQTGVINDDYLFMTTEPNMNINMRYDFQIANPTCASIQAIKRQVKMSFFDLSYNDFSDNGLSYSNNKTVFYLDDQDITLTNKQIVDASFAICNNITSTNNAYPIGNYTFEKHTQTITYTAQFASKFQFYTNVYFNTPEVTETATYYKIFKNGIEQPSYLLKWFIDGCNGGNLLSNVYVALTGEPIYTEFEYSQHSCSILTATILGKDNTGTYVPLPTAPIDIDPFFRQNGVIVNLLDGQAGSQGQANISIQFPSNVPVNAPYYRITLSNGVGEIQSLTAKSFVYTASSGNNQLDNFSPYNDFYNNLLLNRPLLNTVVSRLNGIMTITISDGNTTLAEISHPDTYINNYNIIKSLAPLLQVDYTVGTRPTVSTRKLAFNNTVNIFEGVNYYFNPSYVTIGANDTFALVTDSFSLLFVDNNAYPNNNTDYSSLTKFDHNNIQTELTCDTALGSANYARGVTFDYLRGYNYVNGGDEITIERTVTSAVFSLELGNGDTATQYISDVYYGGSSKLDNVSINGTTYALGLIIDFTKSMANSTDVLSYNIYPSVAPYSLRVTSNPYNTSIVGYKNNTYLTQTASLLDPYFANLKPASIHSANDYQLSITYDVPNLSIYESADGSYIGNPSSVLDASWNLLPSVSHNTLLTGYNVIPAFKIQRNSNTNVFYSSFTSYFVISPPVVSVYGITDFSNNTVTSFPITKSPSYMASFHINHDTNSYAITPSYLLFEPLTFAESSKKAYSAYTIVNNTDKYFRLEGNYVSMKLYSNGIGNSSSNDYAPTVDASSTSIDTLINNSVMTQLDPSSFIYTGSYNNDNLSFTYNNYITTANYNQFIPSANTYNNSANIKFYLGNPFTPESTVYLRLITNQGSNLSFYQSNLVYDVSGDSGSYYAVIDRFDTNTVINYGQLLTGGTLNEVVFPINKHYSKQIQINPNNVIDSSGNINTISNILKSIRYTDVSNAVWITDNSFELQYLGLTLSAVTQQGITNLHDVLTYSSSASLDSKAIYVYLPDIIRVNNVLGNTIYRITNSGNVHAPRVTTSNVSLFISPGVGPTTNNIQGAMDIQSIFTQSSLLNDSPTNPF